MPSLRKLPIGIQDFEKLRTEDYLYVDKTNYVYNLVQTSTSCILCRPRRFGKSLLASTLKAYFEGKKELFSGLKIAELEREWKQYPVIYIDWSQMAYSTLGEVRSTINLILSEYEELWGSNPNEKLFAQRLKGLIKRASAKYNSKVVVIVDEYDKPMIDTMNGLGVNEKVRKLLQGLYGSLKSSDGKLQFVFLTGVTRFGQSNVFSGLNQLINLTLDANYAGACGITQEELESCFQPEIEDVALCLDLSVAQVMAKMKLRYDGYHFADISPDVYNPFSVLNALRIKRFGDYWFETGKPSFLVKALKEKHINIEDYQDDVYIKQSSILDYVVGANDLTPLLYQSGYLTIKGYEDGLYRLGYPNDEIKYGFIEKLVIEFAPKLSEGADFHGSRFAADLKTGDVAGFMDRLANAISLVPYEIHIPREAYYHTICYLMFSQMGAFSVRAEVQTARGRSDMEVETNDTVYIFEYKTNKNGGVDAALEQIETKGYANPYLSSGKRIVKIGVEFDLEKRKLSKWKMK